MSEWRQYELFIEIDTYAGNVERQLVSYAFGASDLAVHGEQSRSDERGWTWWGRDWSPTEEELDADPVLRSNIDLWEEAVVFQDYDDFSWPQRIEKNYAVEGNDRWFVVVEIGAEYWEKYIEIDHCVFLRQRLDEAAEKMGFNIVGVDVRTITSSDARTPFMETVEAP